MQKKPLTVAELTSKAGKVGGKARMTSMTPEERKAFAAKGGKAGGKARAAALSKAQRAEIARKAALARWGKKRKDTSAKGAATSAITSSNRGARHPKRREASKNKPLTVAELTSKAGKVGGKARMTSMTAEERKAFAAQGGKAGGQARAAALTKARRTEIARKGARARWATKQESEEKDA